MSLPTDPIGLSIFIIDTLLTGVDAISAYNRLADGIAAKAQREGRDVTEDEMNLLRGLRDEAAKRRRGE